MSKPEPLKPIAFADHLLSTDNYRVFGGHLIQWNGRYWEELSTPQAERLALHWIADATNAIASAAAAKSTINTALLWIQELKPFAGEDIIIPTKNGYVHFDGHKLVLGPHDRAKGIRYLIDCDYEPSATAPPLFTKFIETILPNAAVRDRVQEYIGYTLTHDARLQRAAIWIGSGANGKGALAAVVQALHRKVATIDIADLGGFNLANLPDASLIFCDEAPAGKIGERAMKGLIAGSKMPIQRKFKETLDAKVNGKWLILTNQVPAIEDSSEGFWRRFDIVPFDVVIPEAERVAMLEEQIIQRELAGVLAWALEGLERLLRRGRFDPNKPEPMAAADRKARIQACCVRAWVDEQEVRLGADAGSTRKTKVYGNYVTWAKSNGLPPKSSIKFWERLENAMRGLVEKRVLQPDGRSTRCCNVIVP